MNCLDAEQQIGIETFFTSFPGVGGKLRTTPQDFIVKERFEFPPKKKDGNFTIAEIRATNWETNLLIRELSNRLHISRKRVGFAGTKDKRAVSTQLMSFYQVPQEVLANITIGDVQIDNIYTSDRPVKIGVLHGNHFEITIRDVNQNVSAVALQQLVDQLHIIGGFPNFYGIQRFGIIRPITHLVGKHIIRGDFEQAVMTYIGNPLKSEEQEMFDLRANLEQTRDYAVALQQYPAPFTFEKAMLNRLVSDPHDFVGALKELPQNLLTMFVYAYQAYLFNKLLSERIRRNLPLNEALPGDVVLPVRKGIITNEMIPVTEHNSVKVNAQLARGKALISGLLFGSDSTFSEGEMGEIEQSIIDREKLDPRDFIIPEIPFISSSGSRRPLLAQVDSLEYDLAKDALREGKQALTLTFSLPKGSYATSLLREIMKADNIRKY